MVGYCGTVDLRKGDIRLPSYMGDGQQYVDRAAEEIDAAIGHTYVTPVEIDLEDEPQYRPTVLLLKKVNWLLASGRLVLDLAASGEDSDLHAYGRQMLNEGLLHLTKLGEGEIVLAGAERIKVRGDDTGLQSRTGPLISNVDEVSRVEQYYTDMAFPVLPAYPRLVPPYGGG